MGGLRRAIWAGAVVAMCATPALAQSVFGKLPESMGGLPADAPPEPKTPYRYPAVHDMPPARHDKTLSDTQQLDLLNQLEHARDRQVRKADEERAAGEDGAAKAPGGTKKKPSAAKKPAKSAAQAGAKANP